MSISQSVTWFSNTKKYNISKSIEGKENENITKQKWTSQKKELRTYKSLSNQSLKTRKKGTKTQKVKLDK